MLIQALCAYFDLLAQEGKLVPEGYSSVRIQYRVWLSPEGSIDGIETWKLSTEKRDKKGNMKTTLVPRMVEMFRRTQKPGIEANYVEHRPAKLFGLNLESNGTLNPMDRTNYAIKSHRAFVETNLAFIEGIDSPVVNAFRQFMLHWEPEKERENPFLLGLGKEYPSSGYVFALSRNPAVMLQDDPQLKARWQAMLTANDVEKDKVVRQCAINGGTAEIARIHYKIGGISSKEMGEKLLVCFDKGSNAFSSYGALLSYNSNISVEAMRKYTQALNYLTGSKAHKTMLGDVTVIFFAMSTDSRCDALAEDALFGSFGGDESNGLLDAAETDALLQKIYAEAAQGMAKPDRLLREQQIDPAVDYYIVGLKPNSSRLAVQFLYRSNLGELIANTARHQADMALAPEGKPVALWQITKQLVSPKATKQVVDPSLTAKLLQSVAYGYRYPPFLLATAVRRIRTDSDDENNTFIKFNPVRAGLLKACLNRDARCAGREEEIGMALNRDNENPAYLCGRLFAILEKIQEQANPGLNRTITDAYFASASTRPALIFPRLIRLAQTHLKKLEYDQYWNRQIGEIVAKLNGEYPDILSLADQGRFGIGYYQQKYAPSEKKQAPVDQKEEVK